MVKCGEEYIIRPCPQHKSEGNKPEYLGKRKKKRKLAYSHLKTNAYKIAIEFQQRY